MLKECLGNGNPFYRHFFGIFLFITTEETITVLVNFKMSMGKSNLRIIHELKLCQFSIWVVMLLNLCRSTTQRRTADRSLVTVYS